MATMKCTSCGGVYETDQPGGFRYFHACPPRPGVTVDRAGKRIDVLLADVLPGDVEIGPTTIERPDKRDENVRVTGYTKDGTAITAAKADGKGAEKVA